jgi:hypothetical protein
MGGEFLDKGEEMVFAVGEGLDEAELGAGAVEIMPETVVTVMRTRSPEIVSRQAGYGLCLGPIKRTRK